MLFVLRVCGIKVEEDRQRPRSGTDSQAAHVISAKFARFSFRFARCFFFGFPSSRTSENDVNSEIWAKGKIAEEMNSRKRRIEPNEMLQTTSHGCVFMFSFRCKLSCSVPVLRGAAAETLSGANGNTPVYL